MDKKRKNMQAVGCGVACRAFRDYPNFTMAFQPIVDCDKQQIIGYEALVRGDCAQNADGLIAEINVDQRYIFDQMCRTKALELSSKLGLNLILSINFLPNAILDPIRCLKKTMAIARQFNFPAENMILEFTETEKISDVNQFAQAIEMYQNRGFRTAIDDFGAGYSGLSLLADLKTNIVKLDMNLIRNIDQDVKRQAILRHCFGLFSELGIDVIAEGVERVEEAQWLQQLGITMMQGYYFAKPGIECLPDVERARFNI